MTRNTKGGSLVPVRISGADDSAVVNTQLSSATVPVATYPYNPVASPNALFDAFGRQRVANPYTMFDSKQLYDSQPLFWDDQQTSGGGTGTSHSPARASTTISVGATTAGVRVRQTYNRFNYQPGKSLLIIMTGVFGATGSGVTKRIGYFDTNNGLYFQYSNSVLSVVRRTYVTGSPVNNPVVQSSWNIDKMDGTGASGVELDMTKAQIMFIDIEWLGVGRVRFGFVVDGAFIYCHQILNANVLSSVYMSTPNLPLRYEITNDGTGAADTLEHICSTVITEGGIEVAGITRAVSTAGTHINADAADTLYAMIGLRLKSTHLSAKIRIDRISIISETNDDFEWSLYLSPTVASTFTYADVTNSYLQRALGVTANTVSGGTLLDAGFSKQNSPVASIINSIRTLGSNIAGTPDTLVLCVRPLSATADYQGTITWTEYS